MNPNLKPSSSPSPSLTPNTHVNERTNALYHWTSSPLKLSLTSGAQPEGSSSTKGLLPRHGHTTSEHSSLTGKFYIFGGGTTASNYTNDVFAYDPRSSSVSLLSSVGQIPPARRRHASALLRHLLIVWGGMTEKRDTMGQWDRALYILNICMCLTTS